MGTCLGDAHLLSHLVSCTLVSYPLASCTLPIWHTWHSNLSQSLPLCYRFHVTSIFKSARHCQSGCNACVLVLGRILPEMCPNGVSNGNINHPPAAADKRATNPSSAAHRRHTGGVYKTSSCYAHTHNHPLFLISGS